MFDVLEVVLDLMFTYDGSWLFVFYVVHILIKLVLQGLSRKKVAVTCVSIAFSVLLFVALSKPLFQVVNSCCHLIIFKGSRMLRQQNLR